MFVGVIELAFRGRFPSESICFVVASVCSVVKVCFDFDERDFQERVLLLERVQVFEDGVYAGVFGSVAWVCSAFDEVEALGVVDEHRAFQRSSRWVVSDRSDTARRGVGEEFDDGGEFGLDDGGEEREGVGAARCCGRIPICVPAFARIWNIRSVGEEVNVVFVFCGRGRFEVHAVVAWPARQGVVWQRGDWDVPCESMVEPGCYVWRVPFLQRRLSPARCGVGIVYPGPFLALGAGDVDQVCRGFEEAWAFVSLVISQGHV